MCFCFFSVKSCQFFRLHYSFPHSYAQSTVMVFFTHFHKKTKTTLLRVSTLFSTSRFCSDVTIQVFFLCTLACHAGCIYYSHMRIHSYMKSSTKCLIPNSFAFPTTIHQIPSKSSSTSVSVWIFRMSTSCHTGWKVLNCLANTTEIIGKKGKHGKFGFLFQVLFLGHWTRLFQFLLLCKYRMLLQ